MPGRTKTQDPIKTLETLLGHAFKDKELATRALTHPSQEGEVHYQRLEFLGDRVLGLVIAATLYRTYPGEGEGQLSRRLAALVRKETLAEVAVALDLGPLIRMTETVERAGGRANPSILADVMEALIGGIYLDGGLAAASGFVKRAWAAHLGGKSVSKDPKSGLQEWAQGRGLPLPEYKTVARKGPDHAPSFTIEVSVEGLGAARADGASKQAAETRAAAKLLAETGNKP